MQHLRFWPLMGIILLRAEAASARWNHREADALNQVTGLGVEYYNDILSYRDLFFDQGAWDRSLVAFRSSAGSLNKKEFLFRQHARIRTSTEDAWQLAYHADRVEEPRRAQNDSALELSYGSDEKTWRLGLLGDGHTEKSFADLGLRFDHTPDEDSHWHLTAWSIDTFYTEKKLQREDHRTTDPWAYAWTIEERWGASRFRLQREEDRPVVWNRLSRDQSYGFRRESSALEWTHDLSETRTFYTKVQEEKESASLHSLSGPDGAAYRDTRHILEIGQRWSEGFESFHAAFWGLMDRTRKQDSNADTAIERIWTRDEWAFLGYWSRPFWNGRHTQQWGLILNQVRLHEERIERSTEVKLSWGPELVLGPRGRVRFITTWDIDQLVHDFPFQRHGFHPWGGGYASFFIVF